uniref:Uncharacterized protein LOC114342172 isoform X2 n=1 Tax=Diabrotica virgifera virgifera TaxID=50390 RepID=A0A6P7GGA8_DIAVI
MEGVLSHSVINYDETNMTDDPGRKKVVVRRGCRQYLEECRRKETDGLRKQKKKKLNVPAGRGICEEDIVILEDKPKPEKKKRSQLMEKNKEKPSSSKKRQKTSKVIMSSESDEDSCNEVVFDDSSDDDWDSFQAKQVDIIEDNITEETNDQDNIYSHQEKHPLQPITAITKQVGCFVIVSYDSNFYPGVIEKIDSKGAIISAMTKTSRENWKWPKPKDELYYSGRTL